MEEDKKPLQQPRRPSLWTAHHSLQRTPLPQTPHPSMNPDLTNLQLISIGIAITIATTFTTVLILTLVYAEEIWRHLQRLDSFEGEGSQELNSELLPSPHTMSSPSTSDDDRPSAQIWHPLAQPPPPVPFTGERSQFGLPPPTNTTQVGRTSWETTLLGPASYAAPWHPNLRTQAPRRGTYGVPREPIRGAALWLLTPMPMPTIPWGPGTQGIENEHSHRSSGTSLSQSSTVPSSNQSRSTASPPYFTREALAVPRVRNGLHSPTYNVTDPFAALWQNYIPFPTTRRNRIQAVPFGQWPDESDTSDSSDEPDQVGQWQWGTGTARATPAESVPRLDHSSSTDPFNVEGPDYEWNTLEQIDRDILSPEQVEAWELHRTDVEARTDWQHWGTCEDIEYFLATNRGAPFHFGAPLTENSWPGFTPTATGSYSTPIPANDAQIYGHEQKRSTDSSASNSSTSPSDSTSDFIGRTNFDDFQYDWESIFPGYDPDNPNWEDPQPLADSPPNPRRPGYYMGQMTSRLIAGAGEGGGDMGDVADPWAGGVPRQPPLPADRTDQLIQQMALLRDENLRLQNDVADLRQQATQWGRPGAPAYRPDLDRYSIPRPPGWAPPGDGPVGDWDANEPPAFLQSRPVIMKLPEPFEGEHDDMDRFIGDCNTYFETFRHQFRGVPSLMVVCATSLFLKRAKDWWTHRWEDFWVDDHRDPTRPRFQYPHWDDFVWEFKATFRDPACEEEHEKRMKNMKMGSNPATVFFQRLEREAKLAGRCHDTDRRSTMVAAVRQGVPWSFMLIIMSIGVGIPQNYDEWKERILIMYEEQQRDRAYNEAHGIGQRDRGNDKKPGSSKQITATSNSKGNAGGATSSSGGNSGRDAQGRWHSVAGKTYGSQGQPMDVDTQEEKKQKQRAEGHCFKCDERGHLSKDCPNKKVAVRAVEAVPTEPLGENTKIEVVKE